MGEVGVVWRGLDCIAEGVEIVVEEGWGVVVRRRIGGGVVRNEDVLEDGDGRRGA